jgi:hypothetical protein
MCDCETTSLLTISDLCAVGYGQGVSSGSFITQGGIWLAAVSAVLTTAFAEVYRLPYSMISVLLSVSHSKRPIVNYSSPVTTILCYGKFTHTRDM